MDNNTEPGVTFYPLPKEDQSVSVYLDGKCVDMDLEEYLIRVVAAEMPASYVPEALKAQAIAARTYTLYRKHNGGCGAHAGADICADSSHCQAYMTDKEMDKAWGGNREKNLQKVTQAVSSTKGKELYYQGEEIQVFYFSSSGGMTENSENVYSKALPYLVSVSSEGEESYANYYGKVTVGYDEFVSRMKKFSPSIQLTGSAADIGEVMRFESGRVESIRVGNETFNGREIRQIFTLNSTNFTIETGDKITFSTVGYGHGVGMSQTGANEMAKKGADYIKILTHYYTGVNIK
jgi:stage II sporulation protein D